MPAFVRESVAQVDPIGIGFGVRSDLFQNFVERSLRMPIPLLACLRGIQNEPRNVEVAISLLACDFEWSETNGTPVAQLPQRERVRQATAEIAYAFFSIRRAQLFADHRQQIARMQTIAHLKSLTAKADER